MKVSKYLDVDLLKTVLQNGFNLIDCEILTTKVETATAPGDCYTSTLYRIFLTVIDKNGDQKKIQFLIKHLIDSEDGAKLVEFMEVYEKEIDMLTNIVPKLSKICKGLRFGPRLYHYFSRSELKIIAMEDLKEFQYQMADRRLGLDYEHCCLAVRKLGRLHAASMILAKDDPSLMDKYSHGLYHGSRETPGQIQQCCILSFPTLCEITKEWKGFEDISCKLERMNNNFWDLVYGNVSKTNDGYRVLTHGDFWLTNFLFKYNEVTGKPIDVILVDFQQCCYTSPAIDLHYFLSTSPQTYVRENLREDLLQIYYDTFASTLADSDYENIPTFADLQDEMRKRELFGFVSAVFVLPIALMEDQSSKGNGIEGLIDADAVTEMTRIMFSGKRYIEAIKLILKRCDHLGLFDIEM